MMKRKVLLVLAWLAVAAICAAIFLLSGQIAEESSEESTWLIGLIEKVFGVAFTDFVIRKFAHMFEFAALGFFSAVAFGYTWRDSKKIIIAFAFSVLYAVSDEIHQLFVPGRAGQVRDVFIDTAGIALGIAAMLLLKKMIHCLGVKKHGKRHNNN